MKGMNKICKREVVSKIEQPKKGNDGPCAASDVEDGFVEPSFVHYLRRVTPFGQTDKVLNDDRLDDSSANAIPTVPRWLIPWDSNVGRRRQQFSANQEDPGPERDFQFSRMSLSHNIK